MVRDWLVRLFGKGKAEELQQPQSSASTRPPLTLALDQYQQRLEGLGDDVQTLLPVLLARDQVGAMLAKTKSLPVESAQQLVKLDSHLRKRVTAALSAKLPKWRQTFRPPETQWWWWFDRELEAREKKSDLLWVLLAGTMLTLTVPLALEIIKRLLVGSPDTLSIIGTLVTLLLTASPLFKRGRELAGWFLERVPGFQPRFQAKAMAVLAVLTFILVGGGWLLLPRLAVFYNNKGHDTLQAGNLTAAQRSFERAVALNPDEAVGYYHLANVYEEIGRPDEAITWYRKALEYDLDLGAAYNNLGRLYILKGELEAAVATLQAGLRHVGDETELERVTRYRLLSNLGWANAVLEQFVRARDVLEDAVAVEDELDVGFASAVPHYYLALVYEALDDSEAARLQWEASLSYLDRDNPDQIGWNDTIDEHLEKLRGDKQ